jgi:methyltransferase-like protein/2-polyprenyl-3-methyl-5-hydroxy-6-metoxy-1,4-benzoquinol methylase
MHSSGRCWCQGRPRIVDFVSGNDGAEAALDRLRASYDEAPYESYAHARSAPGQLAAIAWLFGLDTPEVDTARVLEVGCAAAGNLIPFAAMHPRASAVGIDLAPVHVAQGRERVRALGLDNVELLDGDITQVDLSSRGPFDFIICHGVYSWVPDDVQDAILAVCSSLLADTGVAYVSYNTYPGWKAKEIVRDAMLLSVDDAASPPEKVARARRMVEFLHDVAQPDSVLARAVADHRAMASVSGDYYLLHEELESFNAPCYFRDFVHRARAHGLEYLAEAQPENMFARNYGPLAVDHLLKGHGRDHVLVEQHLDFVVNRSYRQTLLVKAARAERISRTVDRNRNRRLHVAARLQPITGSTLLDHSNQRYGADGVAAIVAYDPAVKAAIDALSARWPWTCSWQELRAAVHARLARAGVEAPADVDVRIDGLMEVLITRGLARYRLDPVCPRPTSTPVRLDESVRRTAELIRDDGEAFVFNHWHESVPLSALDRHLLPLLDGNHDRDALLDAMVDLVRQNVIRIERDDEEVVDVAEVRDVLAGEVDAMPRRLVELKLLRIGEHANTVGRRRHSRTGTERARKPFNPLDLINVSERRRGGGYLHAP